MLQNEIQRFCLVISWLVTIDRCIKKISELLINALRVMSDVEINDLSKLFQHHNLEIGMVYLPNPRPITGSPDIMELKGLSTEKLLNKLTELKAYLELKRLPKRQRVDNFYNLYILLAGTLVLVNHCGARLIEWYSIMDAINRAVLAGRLRMDYAETMCSLDQFNSESDLPWFHIEYLPNGLCASPGLKKFVKTFMGRAHNSLTKVLPKLKTEFSVRHHGQESPNSSPHLSKKRKRRGL